MSPRRPKIKAEPRCCEYCGRDIPTERPVFLVAEVSGRVVGPFHPTCAASVVERQQTAKAGTLPPGHDFGRVVPGASQEELL